MTLKWESIPDRGSAIFEFFVVHTSDSNRPNTHPVSIDARAAGS